MCGRTALYVPSTDHAGIATQVNTKNCCYDEVPILPIGDGSCMKEFVYLLLGVAPPILLLFNHFQLYCSPFFFFLATTIKTVVEKHLSKQGLTRHSMGREKFLQVRISIYTESDVLGLLYVMRERVFVIRVRGGSVRMTNNSLAFAKLQASFSSEYRCGIRKANIVIYIFDDLRETE